MSRLLLAVGILFVVLALMVSSFTLGAFYQARILPQEVPSELGAVWETWQALSENYVEPSKLEPAKLSGGAIRGLLEALDDPYTAYLDPQTHQLEIAHLQGKIEGIGARVEKKEGRLLIFAALPGTPAERAGLGPGDEILEINGESSAKLSLIEAVLKVRGPKGTEVKLLVLRRGAEHPVELTLIREEIALKTVYAELKQGLGYIRITDFGQGTPQEFHQALQGLIVQGAGGLLLDLRDNPGGLLTAVVEIASEFLEDGVVLYEVDRNGEKTPWEAKPGGLAPRLPIAVLVNEFSASGSEVLAGALQDRGRGYLVGKQTFGKGSVNIIYTLSDDSALYITRARWLTPDGRLIEGKGLAPDLIVELTPEDREQGRDPQLEAAMGYLQQKVGQALGVRWSG